MKHWTDDLPYVPCADAIKWLRSQPDAQTAWEKSDRGDWMLYHAGKLAGDPGSDALRPLVLAACACARLSLPFVKEGETRPLIAIETAEQWARGGADAPSLEKVRAAEAYAAEAYAAEADATEAYATEAYAAAYAAYAAYAAEAYAAYAADAADAADAAELLAQCADIVRGFYPKVPK